MNDFGRLTKLIRQQSGELLGDMASKIGVSSAFLSRVESGYAKPSDKMVQNLINTYHLSTKMKTELENAAYALKNKNLFDFSRMTVRDKKVMIALAQQLPNLSDKQIEAINKIIEQGG